MLVDTWHKYIMRLVLREHSTIVGQIIIISHDSPDMTIILYSYNTRIISFALTILNPDLSLAPGHACYIFTPIFCERNNKKTQNKTK